MNSEFIYQLTDVKKSYREKNILDIPDLKLRSGQIQIMVGPNGAGKTALLNILSFLEPPSTGQVQFLGQLVTYQNNDLADRRQQVTLVMQNHFLFSTTVFNNVAYGLRKKGLDPTIIKEKVMTGLALVNLSDFADRPAAQLSGGESKRVALARALVMEPSVLCLDEPTANIDRRHEESIENVIRQINQSKGVSVIMTTHDLNQAYRLGHQIFSLVNGRIVTTSMENVFSGELQETNGLKYLELKPGLKIYVDASHPGPIHICINPRYIILSREKFKSSARNVLTGPITNLAFQGNLVRITINVGVELTAFITKASLDELGLKLGEKITATFKTVSVLVP